MILLVVGLVAVIVVVLIAVFLSIRLGRGDEHDEPDLVSSGRDRRRDQDERWQDRDTRRVPGSRGGRGDYPGYSPRGPAKDRAPRDRDYDTAPRRSARDGSANPSPRRPTPVSSSPHHPTSHGHLGSASEAHAATARAFPSVASGLGTVLERTP